MALQHDVLVIGAGPAGLMAARALAAAGTDFLVIDGKKTIGEPLSCGEGVRADGFRALFGDGPHPFVRNVTRFLEIRTKKTRRVLTAEYLMLDRPVFERWLAEPVLDRVRLETNCLELVRDKDGVTARTTRGEIHAKLVILACGCHYRLPRALGLVHRVPISVPCAGGIGPAPGLAPDRLYFFFDAQQGTGLWVFPKDGGRANIGVAVLPDEVRAPAIRGKVKPHRALPALCARHGLPAPTEHVYGGRFVTEAPLPRTSGERVLACGEAGGLIYGGVGEGIYYALASGKLAGETAAAAVAAGNCGARYLKRYERAWKTSFGREIKAGMVFTRLFAAGLLLGKLDRFIRYARTRDVRALFFEGRIPLKTRFVDWVIRAARPFSRRLRAARLR